MSRDFIIISSSSGNKKTAPESFCWELKSGSVLQVLKDNETLPNAVELIPGMILYWISKSLFILTSFIKIKKSVLIDQSKNLFRIFDCGTRTKTIYSCLEMESTIIVFEKCIIRNFFMPLCDQ